MEVLGIKQHIKVLSVFFGGSTQPISDWVYILYTVVFAIGLISFVIKLIVERRKLTKNEIILYVSLFIASIIVIALSLKYSHDTDYQPQGRYIYPIWIALIIFVVTGFEFVFNLLKKIIKNETFLKFIKILVLLILVMLVLYVQILSTNLTVTFQTLVENVDISDFDKIL